MNLGRGRIGSPPDRAEAAKREALVARARRNEHWQELPAGTLEPRAFWHVDEAGRLFTVFRGEPDHSELTPLYYVVANDGIAYYEAATNPSTWAEVQERQSRPNRVAAP